MTDIPATTEGRNSGEHDTIIIELLGEPKGKGRPRFARRTGRAYTPQKTASYEAMLRHEAALVMANRPVLEGPLRVRVLACFGVPQSWSAKKRTTTARRARTTRIAPDRSWWMGNSTFSTAG